MKLNLKAISEVISAVRDYLFPYEKISKNFLKINDENDLRIFIKEKSAFVTQSTLYGYLKTRMGAKYVLMFEDEIFLGSINKAKWNIYVVALQDLTFYTISYLKNERNHHETEKSKEIFYQILDDELKNEIPKEVFEKAKKQFDERYQNIKWDEYYTSLPFNTSALSLYEWSPIAEELKTLDRKIVLNSMILKWDNVKKEFNELINF